MPLLPSFRGLLFIYALLCVATTACLAQTIDFNNYTPLVSSGNLPEELSSSSTEKYKKNKENISRKERRAIKKLKKQFYLESAFSIDELLRSGKVLYNDPVGNYVNTVFESIKKSAGLSDKSIKLYIVKTNYSNAFATDQGLIFVTTGLISRLKNEDQLAFILCHELVHYIKKHSMDIFLKKNTSQKNSEYLKDFEFLSNATYSKEKETEADIEGLEIFLKTDYKKTAAISVFDVLHYSHLPFENTAFRKDFFGGGDLIWPKHFFVDAVDSIFLDEKTDDALSTHPNTFERKKKIRSALTNVDTAATKNRTSINSTPFFIARNICRYEFCRLALLNANYADAIYAAYILLEENPKSNYLKKVVAKALYGVSTYCNYKKRDELNFRDDIQGESQQVHSFFKKISAYEANVLTVKYLWELNKELPSDSEVVAFLNESLTALTYLHFDNLKVFKTGEIPDNLEYKDDDYGEGDSSESSVRKKRILYAFSSFLSDQAFVGAFTTAASKHQNLKIKITKSLKYPNKKGYEVNPNYGVFLDSLIKYKKEQAAYNLWLAQNKYSGRFNSELKKKKGERVIFYNPIYYSIDERKKIPVKLIASEKTRETFISRLKASAKAAKVPFEVLSDNDLLNTDAEKINNIALINDWIKEYFLHKDIEILPTDFSQINMLQDSLNSNYLCIAGNMFKINKKDDIGYHIMLSVLLPLYSWPYTIPYFLSKEIETEYFMIVINLKERRIVQGGYRHINSRNKEDISLSTFYDFFSQLKMNQGN